MTTASNDQKLEVAADRLATIVQGLRDAALAGRDSYEYAAKIKVITAQFANASVAFCEAFSTVHHDTLDIVGETPCENPEDLAEWCARIAIDRSFAPYEGVRSVRRTPVVDLRPLMMAAE